MSETVSPEFRSPEAIAAGDAASAAFDEIRHTHSLYADSSCECKCGQTFRRTQAFGQHLGAVDRRAWKAWHAAYDATLAATRAERLTPSEAATSL